MSMSKTRDELMAKLKDNIPADQFELWMATENKAFGGKSPSKVLEDNDDEKLWHMIEWIESGITS